MSQLQLSYSASEAFKLMQEFFPNNYQEKINVGKALIIRLKKIYKKSNYRDAYQKYIDQGCREESAIMMLCALQQLVDEEKDAATAFKNSIYGIIEQQNQLVKMRESLETDKLMIDTDKRMLRSYYHGKLAELTKSLEELTTQIEVKEPEYVIVQTSFLGNGNFIQ